MSSGEVNFPCNSRDLAGRNGKPGRESESIDRLPQARSRAGSSVHTSWIVDEAESKVNGSRYTTCSKNIEIISTDWISVAPQLFAWSVSSP